MGLLWSLRFRRQWYELLRMAEAAILVIPKALHAALMKLQILALTRIEAPNLFCTVCTIARGETSSEADLLLWFARLALKKPVMASVALEAYEGALRLFREDKDPKAAFVHIELAEWLLSVRRPWIKASSHIQAAKELLKEFAGRQAVSSMLARKSHTSLSSCAHASFFPSAVLIILAECG